MCIAERQTAGRGRFAKAWYSPFAANLYLSISWRIPKDCTPLHGLSLAMGIATVQALKAYHITDGISIKWPNDIYWQDKKLAGILIEIVAAEQGYQRIIVGIGLNINMLIDKTNAIDKAWTSLEHITHQPHNRNIIAGLLINSVLDKLLEIENLGMEPSLKQWQDYDFLYDKQVTVIEQGQEIKGLCRGINKQGQLLLTIENDKTITCSSGVASILTQLQPLRHKE
jgi:BirA family biotin operon repressor/biotin-[acetyl-CoA-carboxylase] ligase